MNNTCIIPPQPNFRVSNAPDVNTSGRANGYILVWNDTTNKYDHQAVASGLPTQTGNSGKFLTTDGNNASWVTISAGGVWGTITGTLSNQTDLDSALSGKASLSHSHAQSDITNLVTDLSNKQATLVSGTNIKTINSVSLLGSGDIVIGSSSPTIYNLGASLTGATAINFNNGSVQYGTLTGAITVTLSNATAGVQYRLYLTSSGASRTITIPTGHVCIFSTFSIASGLYVIVDITYVNSKYYWVFSDQMVVV